MALPIDNPGAFSIEASFILGQTGRQSELSDSLWEWARLRGISCRVELGVWDAGPDRGPGALALGGLARTLGSTDLGPREPDLNNILAKASVEIIRSATVRVATHLAFLEESFAVGGLSLCSTR